MKTGTVLLIGGGIAALIGTGIAYRNSINDLIVKVWDIRVTDDGQVGVMLKVTNPSNWFGYPVPEMILDVYNAQGAYLGTLYNRQLQWIASGTDSYLIAWLEPDFVQLVAVMLQLLLPANNLSLNMHYIIPIGDLAIEGDTELSIQALNL